VIRENQRVVILGFVICFSLDARVGFLIAGMCAGASKGGASCRRSKKQKNGYWLQEKSGHEITCRETLYRPYWTQDERQS
jgi:hypothetical protein